MIKRLYKIAKISLLLLVIGNPCQAVITEKLLDAIETVESGGKANAIGDNGQAIGAYQIHAIMVKEVNRIIGKDVYSLQDRLNKAKSREMCRIFLTQAEQIAEKRTKKDISDIDISRCWNGGYNGYKSKATINYGKKIKKALTTLK